MSKGIKAIRGMSDVLPETLVLWQHVESVLKQCLLAYGYQEIRFPIVESTDLFCRSIGEVTDIVSKEMYTFADRNGDSLSLRPEGTASCVRACLEHGLLHNQTQRLWYLGPMFRHERPQRGRLRQFYQLGVEAFAMPGPDIDVELLLLSARFWQQLGLAGSLRLEINSLGTQAVRQRYRQQLVEYFSQFEHQLDEDSQKRLTKNPLRILDSKNPAMAEIIQGAPSLHDCFDEESANYFSELKQRLDDAGVVYQVNPRLVRGLDYYCHGVYEWITDELGAQGTVLAGGRYDGLVEQLGGKPTPAVGFALGIERLVELLQQQASELNQAQVDIYLVTDGVNASRQAFLLAEQIRNALPDLRVLTHCGGGSFKSQFKKADKSGARWALIIGEDEAKQQMVAIKPLLAKGEQQSCQQSELIAVLSQLREQS